MLAAIQHSRLSPDAERFLIGYYFQHLAARALYGSSVSVEQFGQTSRGVSDEDIAKAAPFFDSCLEAYPLARGATTSVLPQDPIDRFATCFAAHVSVPSLMEALAKNDRLSADQKREALEMAARANRLEDEMLKVSPSLRAQGLDWPALSRKAEEMTARLPDIGRQDRIIDACFQAYPTATTPGRMP